MIKSRTDSGIGGLKKYEIKILILSIFVIGLFFIPIYARLVGIGPVIVVRIILCCSMFEQIYKIYKLNKINLAADTTEELIIKIIGFKKISLFTFKLGLFFMVPLFLLVFLIPLVIKHDYIMFIVAVISGCVGLVVGVFIYKVNMKNINSVLDSLYELKKYINS